MIKTNLCKTCKYAACVLVPPVIVKDCDLAVIGEAPGAEEERSGLPFIGPSGRLLRATLRDVGFDANKISILNTVSCHPPKNETPKKAAIEMCTNQFLFNQLQEINPKMIMCAGKIASDVFEKDVWQGIPVVKVTHPAAILYAPEKESKFRIEIRKAYNALYPPTYERQMVVVSDLKGLAEAKAWIADKKIVASDIETNNTLDPFDANGRILCVAFGDSKIAYSISLDKDDDIVFQEQATAFVKKVLADENIMHIFHRCWFDVKFLQARGFEVKHFTDTRIMAFLLNENRMEYGLKDLTAEHIGPYEYTIEEKDRHKFGLYNCEDAINTHKLHEIFSKQMPMSVAKVLDRIILPAVPVLNEMMLTGIKIDQKYAVKLKKEILKDKEDAYTELLQKYKMFRGINLASNPQMQAVIFEVLKEKPVKETKTGYSVDGETLNTYAYAGKEWARLLIKIRKAEKLLSTYVEKMPGMVKMDGRIRTQFDPMGTVAGRASSSNPNLQNIPRDDRIYKMFVADEGKRLLYFDFAALELRVACSIAHERKMIEAFNNSIDLHKRTATFITKKKMEDITKEERQLAKGVSFGLLYGQQAEGLKIYLFDKFDIDIPLVEAERIRDIFFASYTALPLWYKRVQAEISKDYQIVYPTGRIRRFPQIRMLGKVPGELFRQAVNAPVQGSGNDCVVFTMSNLFRLIKKRKLPAKFVLTVHDSAMLEIDDDQAVADEIKDMVEMILSDVIPNDDMFRWLRVKLAVEFKQGKSWGDLK